MIGRLSLRRSVVPGLLIGAASAALGSAGPDALVPFRDVAGAASAVSVAFVVDFGGAVGPVVKCVQVPSGENGYAALALFTEQENEATPVYNSSGLLCSINGDPSTGCGQAAPGGYIYWSYWHGTSGRWQYATTGATATMQDGDVEGWRFENPGMSSPNDPPPGAAPDYASICGSAVSATSTTAAPPTPTTAPAIAAPGAASSSPQTAPSSAGARQSTSSGASGASPSTTSNGGPSPPSSSVSGSKAGATGSPTDGGSGPIPPGSVKSGSEAQSLRASPAAARQAGGGSVFPLLIGGGILAALIAASVVRWRKRPEPK